MILYEYKDIFEWLLAQDYQGIPGVFHHDSGKPGPIVGYTVCTHGNEPTGLAAAENLINLLRAEANLLKGQLFIVLQNIEATKRYFAGELYDSRFCDLNMNRMPPNLLTVKNNDQYEILRALELLPVWQQFDCAYDLHSTSAPSRPMIAENCPKNEARELTHNIPIDTVLGLADIKLLGEPVITFFGGKSVIVETGQHTSQQGIDIAKSITVDLLQDKGMLSGNCESERIPKDFYNFKQSVIFPNDSYEFTRIFRNFEPIKAGEVIATNGTEQITAHLDGHTIFAEPRLKPIYIDEEVLFITAPVEKI